MAVTLFGIRHHGPGSARALRQALEELAPELLLIEGPPESTPLLDLVASPELVPPVAILHYDEDRPERYVHSPYAEFSPEWQAFRYGVTHRVEMRLIDLPVRYQLALADRSATGGPNGVSGAGGPDGVELAEDPLAGVAKLAGFDDPEQWWESLVERRACGGDIFPAIHEMMRELRRGQALATDWREAWMRREVRLAAASGRRVAVVCGAWHVPALDPDDPGLPHELDDEHLLAGLPELFRPGGQNNRHYQNRQDIKIQSCWVPWSDHELGLAAGYGAGLAAPGWAEHLWEHEGADSAIIWLGRAAALLRAAGHEVTAAGVIDAVRMAEALTALRGRTRPGLAELADSMLTVFGGETAEAGILTRVRQRMERGERVGRLPEGAASPPLVMDWQRQCRALRLAVKPGVTHLELDLRRPLDQRRSCLLHRLALLGIAWGSLVEVHRTERMAQTGGSFREAWRLVWTPEVSRQLNQAGRQGVTIERAATAAVAAQVISATPTVGQLVSLFERVGQAGLGAALVSGAGLARTLGELLASGIERLAADSTDLTGLMEAFPLLAELERYGSHYGFDPESVTTMADRMMSRVTLRLHEELRADRLAGNPVTVRPALLGEFDYAVRRRGVAVDPWDRSLRKLAGLAGLVGQSEVVAVLAGRATLLLWQACRMTREELMLVLTRLEPLSLSEVAWWIEGFLADAGARLSDDLELFGVLDSWLAAMTADHFLSILPLLRRIFATLPPEIRRQIRMALDSAGVDAGRPVVPPAAPDPDSALDQGRAALVEPILNRLLGLDQPVAGGTA